MALGQLALRGTIGGFMLGHGAQKLFGAFGGHGVEGTAGFFESIGIRPGRPAAIAAGASEAGGGALLLLGALTPLATTAISATMVTAIRKVHLQSGPWNTSGGYEYNAVLIAALTALADVGPGRPAVHPELRGTGWALFSLLGAVAGSFAATHPAVAGPEGPSTDQPEAQRLSADPASPGSPVDAGTTA